MAAVTICSDLEPKKIKSAQSSPSPELSLACASRSGILSYLFCHVLIVNVITPLPFPSPLLSCSVLSPPSLCLLFIPNKNGIHFSNRQTGTDIFAVSEKYAEANSYTLELLLGEFVVIEGLL